VCVRACVCVCACVKVLACACSCVRVLVCAAPACPPARGAATDTPRLPSCPRYTRAAPNVKARALLRAVGICDGRDGPAVVDDAAPAYF
jgi:hypothetical protein